MPRLLGHISVTHLIRGPSKNLLERKQQLAGGRELGLKVNFAQWAAYPGAVSTWPTAAGSRADSFSEKFEFLFQPFQPFRTLTAFQWEEETDKRKSEKSTANYISRYILFFFCFLATLWSRSKARLSLQPWASYLKMAFCLGGIAFALEKGWHLWPKLKTYCWQQQLLLSLLLWLLLSLLIKSSLGVTALLIRRLLLWGLGRGLRWLEVQRAYCCTWLTTRSQSSFIIIFISLLWLILWEKLAVKMRQKKWKEK